MKFTLQCEYEDGTRMTHEFYHEYLGDVLESTELFLRGCGFVNEGYLDFVSDGDFRDSELKNKVEDHSPSYYEFDRNRPLKKYNEEESYNG
jgi:hypothetical protein